MFPNIWYHTVWRDHVTTDTIALHHRPQERNVCTRKFWGFQWWLILSDSSLKPVWSSAALVDEVIIMMKKNSPPRWKSPDGMVRTCLTLSEKPQITNRASDTGGVSVACPTATQPNNDTSELASTNAQARIIARVAAIARSIAAINDGVEVVD